MESLEVVIIGGIVVAFLVAYFSTGSPEMFLENGCPTGFDSTNAKFSFQVRNRGNVDGYAAICIESDKIKFSESENKSALCYTEQRFSPISTELSKRFDVDFAFVDGQLPDTLSIKFSSTCNSKVWGFLAKQCEGFVRTCEYKKEGTWYRLIE